MESFNQGEHVIPPFLYVEKAFDNVWHNGIRYKIYQLDLPTKLCRSLSDFLVGRVIQVKIEGFLSPNVYPKAGVSQDSNLSRLRFLIYVNVMPNPGHNQTNKSQFADDAGQWDVSKNIDLATEYLQRDLDKLARWCVKWRIKLNPEKTSYNILQVPNCNKGKTCFIFIRRPFFVLSSHKVPRYHFWQYDDFHKRLWGNFRTLQAKISLFKDIGQQKVGTKSHSHFTNLQTMCKTNIRIWDCFYHNCFGNCHHQNTKSPELFHQASTTPSKVCVGLFITWGIGTSICKRETHHSRPKPLS